MSVRAAGPGDRAAIAACLGSDATFRADEIEVALALVDDALAGDPDYALVVAERDGAVVGYACFGPTAMTRATWDLYWIAVAAPARGQGVGRALLAAVEAEIRARGGGPAQIRIETGAGPAYAAARALYARAGFAEIARLPDFYAAGDAMIVYYRTS